MIVNEAIRQKQLGELSLENLFYKLAGHATGPTFDRSTGKKAVDPDLLGLAISPNSRHRLAIVGRIPIRVEQHEPIGPDKIETNSSLEH